MKIITVLLFALPLMAQQPLTVPRAFPIADATLAVGPSSSKAWMKDLDQNRPEGRALYGWSVATLLAANTVDMASSWKKHEANPLVASSTPQFGMASVAIKSGFVGASLLMQHFTLRHRPELYKRMAWMNFIASGALGGVAAHNNALR
jgi:hypothetical protein